MQNRLTPNSAYRSIRWLAERIYEFDKKYDFDIPSAKPLLLRYAEELRFLVDEALKMSKVPMMKPIDFKERERRKKNNDKK